MEKAIFKNNIEEGSSQPCPAVHDHYNRCCYFNDLHLFLLIYVQFFTRYLKDSDQKLKKKISRSLFLFRVFFFLFLFCLFLFSPPPTSSLSLSHLLISLPSLLPLPSFFSVFPDILTPSGFHPPAVDPRACAGAWAGGLVGGFVLDLTGSLGQRVCYIERRLSRCKLGLAEIEERYHVLRSRFQGSWHFCVLF